MGFNDFIEKLSEIYYFFEDRYYEILDKVNEKIPVYKVIDPIDRVFPSFILFLILLLLIIFILLLLFLEMKEALLNLLQKLLEA